MTTNNEQPPEASTCIATTKSGASCRRPKRSGSQYCWQHQPDSRTEPQTTQVADEQQLAAELLDYVFANPDVDRQRLQQHPATEVIIPEPKDADTTTPGTTKAKDKSSLLNSVGGVFILGVLASLTAGVILNPTLTAKILAALVALAGAGTASESTQRKTRKKRTLKKKKAAPKKRAVKKKAVKKKKAKKKVGRRYPKKKAVKKKRLGELRTSKRRRW